MKELICIVCPKGCHLTVDKAAGENEYRVTGHLCEKGVTYAQEEMTRPTRVVTSTVRLSGATLRRLPVKTSRGIPKGDIFRAVALLDGAQAAAPVRVGDVIVPNVLGLGVDFVATRSVPALEE